MKVGKLYPQTSPKYDTWEKVYETTLSADTTSVSITGLTGDTDIEYELTVLYHNASTSADEARLRINNDSGSNYGFQAFYGTDTTMTAVRGTSDASVALGSTTNGDDWNYSKTLIYAKSGYVRQILNYGIRNSANNTTLGNVIEWGWVWNNTADEITQLEIFNTQTDGFKPGTYISLYKRIG